MLPSLEASCPDPQESGLCLCIPSLALFPDESTIYNHLLGVWEAVRVGILYFSQKQSLHCLSGAMLGLALEDPHVTKGTSPCKASMS